MNLIKGLPTPDTAIYTIATLPSGNEGDLVYCSDGLAPGESASGTGAFYYHNGTAFVPVHSLGKVPVYATLASVPAAAAGNTGQCVFASDALKASETTGNGTGNLLVSDGTNWIRVDTGATAGA